MKKIYGNEFLVSTLGNMIKKEKPVNSVIFYGEKGSGRKLVADYYTSQLLCENPVNGSPCGTCVSCRNVQAGIHPDVTYVQTSGKLGGYSVNTAREIRNDAFVKPNNKTGRKIYIFRDCHNMDARTQNMLLKIVEEPPEYAYFIFTSESKYEFLSTIISRCMCFGVSLCTEEQAEQALNENGFGSEEIKNALDCFHGNIGMCIEYIQNERLRKQVDLTKKLSDSIIRKDEYNLNAVFFSAGSDRNSIYEVLSFTDKLIRDSAVLSEDHNAPVIGCYREGALRLSSMITSGQAVKIHERIENAWKAIETNVTAPLVLAALSAEISEIIV